MAAEFPSPACDRHLWPSLVVPLEIDPDALAALRSGAAGLCVDGDVLGDLILDAYRTADAAANALLHTDINPRGEILPGGQRSRPGTGLLLRRDQTGRAAGAWPLGRAEAQTIEPELAPDGAEEIGSAAAGQLR